MIQNESPVSLPWNPWILLAPFHHGFFFLFFFFYFSCVVQDSVVGIATCYGLDSLGFESEWGRHLLLALGPLASYTMGTRSFPGVKWPECGVDHPPPSSAEFKARNRALPVLHRFDFKACYRVNFTLSFYFNFIS